MDPLALVPHPWQKGVVTLATVDSRVRSGSLTFTPGTGLERDYSAQATSVAIVPNTNTEDSVEVLDGTRIGGTNTAADTLDFTIISDLTASNGLVAFSWNYRGNTIAFEFVPDNDPLNTWTGTVTMQALQVGGAVGEQLSVEGSLPILTIDPPTSYGDGSIHTGVPTS